MDPLSEIGEQVSRNTVNQNLEILIREVREHKAWHRRAHKTALGVFSTVGGLLIGAIGWGATEYRGRAEALAREQAREIAIQQVRDARSEHSELRAADQRLSEEQVKQGRELQALAMHRLEVKREASPR